MVIAWQRQAITWINVDSSLARSRDIHLRAILQEITAALITEISLKMIYIEFYSNLPGQMSCGIYL